LKGWDNNVEGQLRRHRDLIAGQLDFVDKNSEIAGLSAADYELRCILQEKLSKILKEEELKWFQRAKERDLLGAFRCIDRKESCSAWCWLF
jgi:hypothetical protein